MKKMLFTTLFCLVAMPALCQEDLQMFETDTAPRLSEKQERVPNIGNDAKKLDKVKISSVLPSVSVSSNGSMPAEKPSLNTASKARPEVKPAENRVAENLSKPVDFSADITKDISIVVPQKTDAALQKTEVKPREGAIEDEIGQNPKTKPAKMALPMFNNKKEEQQTVKVSEAPKVELFNIADIYLGMQPEDVIETAAESGFELTNVAYGIPSFMVTDYERMCRESGLYQTRLIHECIRESAKDNDVYYVSQLVFDRLDSKEKIIVLFSSALTDNKAFKIDYTAFGDNSLGTSYKDLLKKTHRRDIFWKYVYDKYGKPQGQKVFFWGSPKKVYLKAFLERNSMDGRIVLEDVQQTGIDYTQAEAVDKEKDINNPFHF